MEKQIGLVELRQGPLGVQSLPLGRCMAWPARDWGPSFRAECFFPIWPAADVDRQEEALVRER
jgi:hypothetical protein